MRNFFFTVALILLAGPLSEGASPGRKTAEAAEPPPAKVEEESPAKRSEGKAKAKAKPAKEKDEDAKTDETEALFVKRIVPNLSIEISEEGMQTLRNYNYIWRQNSPERIDVKATVREGDKVYTDVAIHLKGSYSFQPIDSRPSLTLNFNKFNKGQEFHGLTKLHLNNAVQDFSYLSEAFARDLFNDLGVPAPRAGHAIVTLNGRRIGLYVLLEGANKPFLKRHFASLKGNLYDAGSGGEITKALEVDSGEHPEDRSELDKLIKATEEPDPAERWKKLEQLLDIDRFLSFVAGEVLLVHWDGYSTGAPNNYRVFHDMETGKFTFMPHGLDQLLRSGSAAQKLTPHFNGIVARGLMTTPEGRRRYLERLTSIASKEFTQEALLERVERLAIPLRVALTADAQTLARFNSGVSYLKSTIATRTSNVARLLKTPPKPVTFDGTNPVVLTSWQFKASNTNPASSRKVVMDEREILQVVSRGPETSGSWRTQLLLEDGLYEFTGRARTEGFKATDHSDEEKLGNELPDKGDAANTNRDNVEVEKTVPAKEGVILRMSGEKLPNSSTSSEWTTIHYEFRVHGIEDVELVCEFRGAAGIGMFDPGSMRLIRRPTP